MSVYGDNWIRINAKKKFLHEQYLRTLMESHDKIVNDIATHIGTRYPHMRGVEASVEDLKKKLNAFAPKGGHTSHQSALESIRDHIEDNDSIREKLEIKHLSDSGIHPEDWDDVNFDPDVYTDWIHDTAHHLSTKQ